MTPAQKSALEWLRNRNGDGVFEAPHYHLVAAGERASVQHVTWIGLCNLGFVEFYSGVKRLRVTVAGMRVDLSGDEESSRQWAAE